ncbi:MAG: hypothetical protein LM583_10105, partial [Desulfurococcaceae archaeon]|nr:hypothetical protein [Desulfurococcaceae archaeon]
RTSGNSQKGVESQILYFVKVSPGCIAGGKLPKGSRKLDVEVKVEECGEKRVTVIDTKDSRAD